MTMNMMMYVSDMFSFYLASLISLALIDFGPNQYSLFLQYFFLIFHCQMSKLFCIVDTKNNWKRSLKLRTLKALLLSRLGWFVGIQLCYLLNDKHRGFQGCSFLVYIFKGDRIFRSSCLEILTHATLRIT